MCVGELKDKVKEVSEIEGKERDEGEERKDKIGGMLERAGCSPLLLQTLDPSSSPSLHQELASRASPRGPQAPGFQEEMRRTGHGGGADHISPAAPLGGVPFLHNSPL